jgi:hypothetical protein
MIVELILSAIVIWITFAIILPFLLLPNFYLRKSQIQKSPYLKSLAKTLKRKSQEETLKAVFRFVTENYSGEREKLKLVNYFKLFETDIEKNLKKRHQFFACHIQNLIITTLLINTTQFNKKEIIRKVGIGPYPAAHQHLIIKTNHKIFKVDPFYEILKEI